MDVDSPLEDLSRRTGSAFAGLIRARRATPEALGRLRAACSGIDVPADCAIVAEGSLGRQEATSGSDADLLLLARSAEGVEGEGLQSALREAAAAAGFRLPSAAGPFADGVVLPHIMEAIGGDADSNTVVTHRMLLLLESRPVVNEAVWSRSVEDLLGSYLAKKPAVKDQQPPRFLLNDLVRYWRTLCVDYEGKVRNAEEKWAIRNAKLRTSRKMLFAGGLFPLLECSGKTKEEIPEFLVARFGLPSADRVAAAALSIGEEEAGANALTAYAEFLELLDVEDWRTSLENLPYEDRGSSPEFQQVKKIGARLEEGLAGMLFGERLGPLVRDYLVF